jgi:hypothetical protein
LVATEADDPLEPERVPAEPLARHVPHRLEPRSQRFPGALEDSPRSYGGLSLTFGAPE